MGYIHSFEEPYDLDRAPGAVACRRSTSTTGPTALDFALRARPRQFAVLDHKLDQWEVGFTAGIGVGSESEVIPRDQGVPRLHQLAHPAEHRREHALLFPRRSGSRVNLGIRDYLFIDKFEPTNRSLDDEQCDRRRCRRTNADSSFINNIITVPDRPLASGSSTSFEYTTFRVDSSLGEKPTLATLLIGAAACWCSSQRWSRSAVQQLSPRARRGMPAASTKRRRGSPPPLARQEPLRGDAAVRVVDRRRLRNTPSAVASSSSITSATCSRSVSSASARRRCTPASSTRCWPPCPTPRATRRRIRRRRSSSTTSTRSRSTARRTSASRRGTASSPRSASAYVAFDSLPGRRVVRAVLKSNCPTTPGLCDDTHPGTSLPGMNDMDHSGG